MWFGFKIYSWKHFGIFVPITTGDETIWIYAKIASAMFALKSVKNILPLKIRKVIYVASLSMGATGRQVGNNHRSQWTLILLNQRGLLVSINSGSVDLLYTV